MAVSSSDSRTTKTSDGVPDRAEPATTVSGTPIELLYSQESLAQLGFRPELHLGEPGRHPYTRGIHPTMYRGRLWTVRQFAGFGTPRQTNQRFHFLLERGQTGLSTAFDLPTLMGLDSDDPRAAGEVGRLGVAVDTVDDIRELFHGIDLGKVSVSMTINSPAIVIMAFFLVHAEESGFDWQKLRGTIQNDILKEFHAQNEFVFPPEPSVRLVVDLIEYCTAQVPQWNTVSISGYHIREAGATAVQELAITLADGMHYVEQCLARGMAVDDFASRLSFFFNAHNDVFEEVAKYRAARAIWADLMQNRYGALQESSRKLRFHAQTAGCTLQDRQPEVNLIRVAYQALAAVLGGCQSLHTNSMDETLSLPSEHAVTLALRTQQVLAYETGVPNTVDPLGGSYFVESLTTAMRREAEAYFETIGQHGGMIRAIETGFFRREIADSAFAWQQAVDSRQKIVVGMNAFEESAETSHALQALDDTAEQEQLAALRRTKESRNAGQWQAALDELRHDAKQGRNLFPAVLRAARARATVGEIMNALADVFGRYAPGGAKRMLTPPRIAPRVLLSKIGLDGHDRGIRIVARGLRDAGFHVIYAGMWLSPEAVVQAALDEDVSWLGISLLSGAHMTLVPRVQELLRQRGMHDVGILIGGIIPGEDVPRLLELGVKGIFGPGTPISKIVDFLRQNTKSTDMTDLAQRFRQHDRRALSRLLTLAAQGVLPDSLREEVLGTPSDTPCTGRTVAFTGGGGVGKSSLIARLVDRLRRQEQTVAVLCCDPESPLTGGALLGDRVRIASPAEDQGRFIRSLSTRAGQQAIAVHLDVMMVLLRLYGFQTVILETVGAGQGDIAVREVADRLVVLLQPETGDELQWEKAGILEVADVVVVHKSDLPGAEATYSQVHELLNLPGSRTVPVLKVSAAKDEGLEALCRELKLEEASEGSRGEDMGNEEG